MLLATDNPTDDEHAATRIALRWGDRAFTLAGVVRASLENQASSGG